MLRILILAAFPMAALAQDTGYDPTVLESCLWDKEFADTSDCIGLGAQHCQFSGAGSSTVGVAYCYESEWRDWDARLNTAYQKLIDIEKANDAEMAELGSAAPKTAPALKAMQQAWISFRDAACEYEYTQWGGGTGAGPASNECMMRLTARQTLDLLDRLKEVEQ